MAEFGVAVKAERKIAIYRLGRPIVKLFGLPAPSFSENIAGIPATAPLLVIKDGSTMPIVKFAKEKKEIEVPEGANLRAEAIKAGINLNQGVNGYGESMNKFFNCKGIGACGTCRVLVKEGMDNTNAMTAREKLRFRTPILPDPVPCLAFIGHEKEMRLACMTCVNGDVEVESGPEINLFGENFFS